VSSNKRSGPSAPPGCEDFGIPAEQSWAMLLDIDPFSEADGDRAFYRI